MFGLSNWLTTLIIVVLVLVVLYVLKKIFFGILSKVHKDAYLEGMHDAIKLSFSLDKVMNSICKVEENKARASTDKDDKDDKDDEKA